MTRRQETNEALRDWEEFYANVESMNQDIRALLVRDRFAPGKKIQSPLLGYGVRGSVGPAYDDPTGDDASDPEEVGDRTHEEIVKLEDLIQRAKTTTEKLLKLTLTDVRLRAERQIPNCLACNKLIYDIVKAGFCTTCYRRWLRQGRPDRPRFIVETLKMYGSTAASVGPSPAQTVTTN